jgi:hypothetical protein
MGWLLLLSVFAEEALAKPLTNNFVVSFVLWILLNIYKNKIYYNLLPRCLYLNSNNIN